MGKGSGNTTSTVTQQNIPKEFFPYFDRVLARGEEASLKPYTAYGGERLAGQTGDTMAAYGLTRDIANRGTPAADAASGVYQGNIDQSQALAGQGPYQFSQFGGFNAGQADPYAGFKASGAAPYSEFSAYKAQPSGEFSQSDFSQFGDFRAGQADPYAGFRATSVDPYTDFAAYKADPYAKFNEAQFSEYGFGPTETLNAQTTAQYMDPYLRNVLDVQKKQAEEDYQTSQAGRNAAAVSAGAFGGSRQQVAESLAERGMLDRMQEIEATGQQAAYQDAVSRFGADRAAKFQADQARAGEKARVQAGSAGEAARVQAGQASELGRVQSLNSAELARLQQSQAAERARVQGISVDEAARIQQSEAAEIARTQGISIDEASRVQAARASEAGRVQSGIAAEAARVQAARAEDAARIQQMDAGEFARVQQSQAAELARTQGISVDEAARIQQAQAAEIARTQGISIQEAARVQASRAAEMARVQTSQAGELNQNIQNQLSIMGFKGDMASQMTQLEEAARAGDIQSAQMLETIGKAQQAQQQASLDLGYEDFLRQQGYDQQQLGFMSNMLQGLPIQKAGDTVQQTPYNPVQQALGAGLSALSLYKGFGG